MSEPRCQWVKMVGCGQTEFGHYAHPHTHDFRPPPRRPEPHEIVNALVVTSWTCHLCGADCDVWGEGAVGGWMECGTCLGNSWLEVDAAGPSTM